MFLDCFLLVCCALLMCFLEVSNDFLVFFGMFWCILVCFGVFWWVIMRNSLAS